MPKINVYLPDQLAAAVKEAGVPVSAVCQEALTEAVARIRVIRSAIAMLRDPATPANALRKIGTAIRTRMTPRLAAALQVAVLDDQGQAREAVSSLDLLRGLLGDGENFAVRLLLTHGVSVDGLVEGIVADVPSELSPVSEPGDTLLARLTMPARLAYASALEAVVDLGHNYVGCEHLLLGLADSESRAQDLLAGQGVQAPALRQTLSAAAAGVAIERSRALDQESDALADLMRRVEALERRLGGGTS
jgi:ATP-dependent Clp protease ATP-binding subunit ClpC